MELDDLKSAWAQYDKKLTQTLKFNEDLLRKINLNDSKRELQKPLMYEFSGVVGMVVLIAANLGFTIRLMDEPKYYIPGFFSVIIAIVYFVFAIIKANRFLTIDHYGTSVIKLQRDIAKLNQLVLRLRKYELIMIPLFIVPSLPLLFKSIYHIDVYSNVKLFSLTALLILGIGFPMTFWINKQVYDKKFQNSVKLLHEIDNYSSDY